MLLHGPGRPGARVKAERRRRLWPLPLLALVLGLGLNLGLGGCASFSFYGQAVSGQWALLAKSRPVAEVQADAATPDAVVQGLAQAQRILRFAEDSLALPVGQRYQRYLALDREAVVFNVFSVSPGTFALKTWCFPIAGCVPYRGYFSREGAQAEGDRLRALGHDVYLGAAGAYSTLGWLPDPLLSTFPWEDAPALAELLFHELAHSVLYVPGEAAFNEAFATAVGRAGRQRWVVAQGRAALEAQGARSAQRACFAGVVSALRAALAERFAGPSPGPSEAAQAALWAAARHRAEALALGPGAEAYFSPPHSLARLLATSTYEQAVPAFEAALAAAGGDLPAFYAAMAALDPGQRQALMASAVEPAGGAVCAAPL